MDAIRHRSRIALDRDGPVSHEHPAAARVRQAHHTPGKAMDEHIQLPEARH